MPSSLPARLPSALAAGLLATGLLLAGLVAAPAAPASAAPAPAPTTASLPKDQLVVPPSALARADALDDAPTTGPVVHTLWVSTVSATAATTDDTVASLDRASVDAAVTALHDYWWEESGGRVDVRLGGVEERSLGGTSCDASATLSKVKASAFGGSFASYGWAGTEKHLLVLPREACGTQAFGTIGGDGGEIVSSYGLGQQLGVPVLLHEFGHNLGLGHAGSALCRSTTSFDGAPGDFRSTADAACPTEEYGDHLDIMGYSVSGARPHLSSPQRMRLGWMPSTVALSTPATSKRVVLPSLDTAAAGRAVDVTDPVSGQHYVLEYRTATGRDRSSAEFAGGAPRCTVVATGFTKCALDSSAATGSVRVLRALPQPGGFATTVALAVGTDAAADPARRDTHLDAGESFTSAGGGFTVAVASLSPQGGAVLDVSLRGPRGAVSTSTALTLSTASQTYGGAGATATAVVSRADGTAPAGTVSLVDGSTVLSTVPVGTGGRTTIAVPTTLAAGSHALRASFTPADPALAASSSAPQTLTVAAGATTTSLRVSGPQQTFGSTTTTLTATVPPVAGSWPAGSVTFTRSGVPVAVVPLASGTASWVVPASTSAGQWSFTASFAPSSTSLVKSVSAPQTVTVVPASSTVAITPATTSPARNTATTATVTVRVAGVASPAGSVTVLSDGRAVQTVALTSTGQGTATVTLPRYATAGSPVISVRYSGTPDVLGSTSAGVTLRVR